VEEGAVEDSVGEPVGSTARTVEDIPKDGSLVNGEDDIEDSEIEPRGTPAETADSDVGNLVFEVEAVIADSIEGDIKPFEAEAKPLDVLALTNEAEACMGRVDDGGVRTEDPGKI